MRGDFGTNAVGTAVAKLAMEMFAKDIKAIEGVSEQDKNALIQLLGLTVAKATTQLVGGSTIDGNAAGVAAKLATEFNYLRHEQSKKKRSELANCGSKENCDIVKEKFNKIDQQQTHEAQTCLANGTCDSVMVSINEVKQARDTLRIVCTSFCSNDDHQSLKELESYFLPSGDINKDALRTGKVDWTQLGKAGIGVLGSVAGVATGTILLGAGGMMVLAPEPTGVSKAGGTLTVAVGAANLADSSYGLYSSLVNFYRASQGSLVYLPQGGFSWAADKLAPGSQTAQDYAQLAALNLALASGRVHVGTIQVYGDSALAHYVPTGINGMLNASAVQPAGAFRHVLIPHAKPGVSTASWLLDRTQIFQLGNTYYENIPRIVHPIPSYSSDMK